MDQSAEGREPKQCQGAQDVNLEADRNRAHQSGIGCEGDYSADPRSHGVKHVMMAEKDVVQAQCR